MTGAAGMLGSQLLLSVPDGITPIGTDLREATGVNVPGVDLAEPDQVRALMAEHGPFTGVLHCAAFAEVDLAEQQEEVALRVNGRMCGLLAEVCAELDIPLVIVGTDFVFDGSSGEPYREDQEPSPLGAYGRTKLAGEERVLTTSANSLIVRTSWLFGRGRNFIAAILAQAQERRTGRAGGPLRAVDDQYGRPTYAHDLAEAIVYLAERGTGGLYHVANRGVASWWELARASLDEAGYEDLSVERIRTDELTVDAPRPMRSVLDCSKAEALGVKMRNWRDAVSAYLTSSDSPILTGRGID